MRSKSKQNHSTPSTTNTKPPVDVNAIVKDLLSAPDTSCIKVLEVLLPTGVADMIQLQAATDLSRDQVNRVMKRFDELAPDAIVVRIPETIKRPGRKGTPVVFKLGEVGAAVLRTQGHSDAHACGIEEVKAISHARVTLEVRLAALKAGLQVETERELRHGEAVLRPDNLVRLPDGTWAIFETEQQADMSLLRRVVESQRHKVRFFRERTGHDISPIIRVVINLPVGTAFDQTSAVWEKAYAIVSEEFGGDLPFRIVAIPLYEFLDAPDWANPPSDRWELLFDPAQTSSFAPASAPGSSIAIATNKIVKRLPTLPAQLKRRTAADDRRVTQAYYQYILEQGPHFGCTDDVPQSDPEFFVIVRIIYSASHRSDATPWQQAAYPTASLYLLKKYLQIHPKLRDALNKAITRGSGSMRWNPTTIMHKMQVLIARFLKYHGFQVCRALQAYPTTAGWDATGPRDFRVSVSLHPEVLLGDADGVLPGKIEVQQAQESLAWVLWAILAYAEDLGLKTALFW